MTTEKQPTVASMQPFVIPLLPINQIICGDNLETMRTWPSNSVHCCVTSPPYWGLRDYGHDGQIGLEDTPEAYVARMVEVFREVRRVLRDDGTLWLNLGASFWNHSPVRKSSAGAFDKEWTGGKISAGERRRANGHPTLKMKDLVGIPWRVAFALQADGWWLRQDIIWHKSNPMPESVRDRCTKAHEYVFLLTKRARYYMDMEPIREPIKESNNGSIRSPKLGPDRMTNSREMNEVQYAEIKGANRRSVWTVATQPYSGAHFATFPPDLIRPMILAGCPKGGIVLDPFIGSGTTGKVARELNRNYIGIDLNPKYCEEIAAKRTKNVQPYLEIMT